MSDVPDSLAAGKPQASGRVAGTHATGWAALGIRVEQALLGSVLSDPSGQGYLLGVVSSDDFRRPYHGQVLLAMQRLRSDGRAATPEAVYQEIRNDPDLPSSVSGNGVLLVDLMEAAPRPGHAPAYAGIVIGIGIRRQITLAASRMGQAARDRDLTTAVTMANRARREVRCCQDRWLALPGAVQRELPLMPGVTDHRSIAQSASEARDEIRKLRQEVLDGRETAPGHRLASLTHRIAGLAEASAELHERGSTKQAETGPGDRQTGEAEGRALRDLVAGPFQMGSVGRWLRSDHFTDPRHRAAYSVIRDLAAGGQPVDPVTVAWEASRRGIPVDIADLSGGTSAFAVDSAREVARSGILAQIGAAAREVQAHAADRRLPTGLVLAQADARLDELQRHWPQRGAAPVWGMAVRSLRTPALRDRAGQTAGSIKEASP